MMNKLQDFSKHLAKNATNSEQLHWRGQKLVGLGASETGNDSGKPTNTRSKWIQRVTKAIARDDS